MAPIGVSIGDSEADAKNSFIQQAHEARQARELARQQDKAATTIQAFFRSFQTRRKLKIDACSQLGVSAKQLSCLDLTTHQIGDNHPQVPFLTLFRRIVFFCDPAKDQNVLNDLILVIGSMITPPKTMASSTETKDKDNTDVEMTNLDDANGPLGEDVIMESHEEKVPSDKTTPIPRDCFHFDLEVLNEVARGSVYLERWVKLTAFLVNLCLTNIESFDHKSLDAQIIATNLRVVRAFISKNYHSDVSKSNEESRILREFNKRIISQTLNKSETYFENLSTIIGSHNKFNCSTDNFKDELIKDLVLTMIGALRLDDLPPNFEHPSVSDRVKELVESLVRIFSAPAIVYHIEKYSSVAFKELNSNHIFEILLKSTATCQSPMKRLTSTSALFLLANVIHLAKNNEEIVKQYLADFSTLLTRLLDSCKENMIQANPRNDDSKSQNRSSTKKKRELKVVSYNPLLGWLPREKDVTIDKRTIEYQISTLWNAKFLKIMFEDLIKANTARVLSQNAELANCKTLDANFDQRQKESLYVHRNPNPQYRQTILSNISATISPIGLFRRVVGRRTSFTTPLKTNNVKNSFNYNLKKCRLLSPEAHRISLVCNMYHSALEALTTIKQDILTGICLNHYLVTNLWTYICSLSPQNGLHAFIQLLTILKIQAPEYHILILFCECASHLVNVLDDSELYEMQRPFKHQDLIDISSFLNYFVFHILSNNLVNMDTKSDPDPLLSKTHKLLRDLHVRDCRRKFTPDGHWLIKDIKLPNFLKDIEAKKPTATKVLHMMPHIIPHQERVQIFKRFVTLDKLIARPSTLITIHRSRIVEDGYQQLARLSPNALKGLIRVKFINDFGLDEAGIDQDGVFKEFLEDTIKRVFDPALNLFRLTSEQCLYPSPTSRLHEDHLSLFKFVGKMLGKAIYEGIVVDVPFALFFLSRVIGQPQNSLYSPLDELPSLDPDLYKSLTYIKHYEGDVSDLNLTFSIDQDFMGKIETYDLEPGGKSIPVTRQNCVKYIHSVATFHLRTQIDKQTEAFIKGFRSIIDPDWLAMFSASDLQRLISGDTTPIDLNDLRRHTKYFNGFHNSHRVISWLWDILEKDFTPEEHKLFLKFVTSCSKPPLLGFSNLEPPFSIRCVEVSDDLDLGDTIGSVLRGFLAIRRSDPVDRLPTSSTCFNLLKLPNYQRRSTLREKLRYAIHSNTGFELS